jgi:transcriptional regulator with XRE-family HTH domain
MRQDLRLDDPLLPAALARLIREARTLIGWSQQELAARANTSQARISRFERGVVPDLDVATLARVLDALGLRGAIVVSDHLLDDRRRQVDPVHAALTSLLSRHLRRLGWTVATEVAIGGPRPRGWIDLAAWRPRDGSGLIAEVKGDLPDVGGLLRQVRFYASAANETMRSLGWRPSRITTLVLALDSAAVHATIRANATLLRSVAPGRTTAMAEWLATAGLPVPPPTICLADLAGRRMDCLRRSPLDGRRAPPAYAGYADAAARLRRRAA